MRILIFIQLGQESKDSSQMVSGWGLVPCTPTGRAWSWISCEKLTWALATRWGRQHQHGTCSPSGTVIPAQNGANGIMPFLNMENHCTKTEWCKTTMGMSRNRHCKLLGRNTSHIFYLYFKLEKKKQTTCMKSEWDVPKPCFMASENK